MALRPRFGFHDNSVTGGRAGPAEIARLVEGTGAGLYRTLIDWRTAEPEQNRYDFALPDAVYRAMLARGIKPVFILAWAPDWARDKREACVEPHCHLPPAPEFYGEWREFAGLMAQRYPRAAGIEIWNEPNESSGWNGGVDPDRFTELLREAHGAIKAVAPSMPVISGGLSNRYDSGQGSLSIADFAGRFLRTGAGYIDGIGIHPYATVDDLRSINRPIDLLRSLSPQRKPIWVTEVGTSTSGGPMGASEEEQARAAVYTYERFSRDPGVDAILMHTLIDPQPAHVPPEDVGYGVLRADLSPKPAYCALARATGARSSCP